MTFVEPHNATCDRCGGLLINAVRGRSHDSEERRERITLDAAPHPDGTHEAWNRGDIWLARPYAPGAPFHGSRRREHVCVIPDRQLELSTEASPPADPVPQQEAAACSHATSRSSTPPESSC